MDNLKLLNLLSFDLKPKNGNGLFFRWTRINYHLSTKCYIAIIHTNELTFRLVWIYQYYYFYSDSEPQYQQFTEFSYNQPLQTTNNTF